LVSRLGFVETSVNERERDEPLAKALPRGKVIAIDIEPEKEIPPGIQSQ